MVKVWRVSLGLCRDHPIQDLGIQAYIHRTAPKRARGRGERERSVPLDDNGLRKKSDHFWCAIGGKFQMSNIFTRGRTCADASSIDRDSKAKIFLTQSDHPAIPAGRSAIPQPSTIPCRTGIPESRTAESRDRFRDLDNSWMDPSTVLIRGMG